MSDKTLDALELELAFDVADRNRNFLLAGWLRELQTLRATAAEARREGAQALADVVFRACDEAMQPWPGDEEEIPDDVAFAAARLKGITQNALRSAAENRK